MAAEKDGKLSQYKGAFDGEVFLFPPLIPNRRRLSIGEFTCLQAENEGVPLEGGGRFQIQFFIYRLFRFSAQSSFASNGNANSDVLDGLVQDGCCIQRGKRDFQGFPRFRYIRRCRVR